MTNESTSSADAAAPSRETFATDSRLAVASGFGGSLAGSNTILGQNTLGATGVPRVTYTSNAIGDPFPISATLVNEYTVLSIPAFWRAINFICYGLASLPAEVCRRNPDGTRDRVPEHPLNWILNDEINDLQTPIETRALQFQHAIIWGSGCKLIDRDDMGRPQALWNMMPDRVIPFRFIGPDNRPKQWYAIGANSSVGGLHVIPSTEVIHIMGLGFDGLRGYPLVQLMNQALRIGRAAEAFGDRFFTNGGHMYGAIESEKPLTPEQMATIRADISAGHTGVEKAHKWMVLPNGAKAHALTVQPETAQFLETRQFSVLDVCRILQVPPHIVYDLGRATWDNLEQMSIELVKYSLAPWKTKTEQEYSRKLLTTVERRSGLYIRLDVEALERGDALQQIDAATKRIGAGQSSINEERTKQHLPGIGAAGDTHFISTTLQTVDSATAPPPSPPTVPAATTTPPPAAQFSADHFSELFAAASKRVGSKTSSATDKARAKFLNTSPQQMTNWTAWGNVLAQDQEKYAAESLLPVLVTYKRISGQPIEPQQMATACGRQYSNSLKSYFSQLAQGVEGTPPDLAAICDTTLKGNRQ